MTDDGGRVDPVPPRLTIAALIAAGLLIAALASRIARPDGLSGDPSSFLDLLLAAACLLAALLTIRRAPALAWPALVIASALATTELFQLARALFGPDGRISTGPSPTGPDASRWLSGALLVTVAAVMTALVAALYAGRPDRPLTRRAWPWALATVGWIAVACGVTIVLTLAGWHDDPTFTWVDVVTLPIDVWFVFVVSLTAVGAAGDLWPAAVRASARISAGPDEGRPPAFAWMGAFLDEVSGRAASRRAAAEAERSRLASELHAEVLPTLRRIESDLTGGRVGPGAVTALREVADRLDDAMAERRDVVLEQLGLVEALEESAERIQDRTDVEVRLEVRDGGQAVGRPPLPVEVAALRIARLAMDNAVRHGAPRTIAITVAAAPTAVSLEIANDGRPIEPGALERAARDGRRGVLEMRESAAAVGGRLAMGNGEGSGPRVRFDWPA